MTGRFGPYVQLGEQQEGTKKKPKRASLFSTMVGMLLPGTGAIYRSQTLRFLLPVYVGDTVTAHFVVRSVDRVKHRLEIDGGYHIWKFDDFDVVAVFEEFASLR